MVKLDNYFDRVEITNEQIDATIESILLNTSIRNFIYEHDLDKSLVTESLIDFINFKEDEFINDEGHTESKKYKGFYPVLVLDNNKIKISYKRIKPDLSSRILMFNMPSSNGNESIDDFSLITEERKKAYNYARRFINTFKTDQKIKGMYLAGDFRSGKTYLALAIAREIAKKGYNVCEIYYPELSTILKGSIAKETDDSFIDLINELKNCDLLILDDFGGEAMNPFIRDEALGVVLNYRMNKKYPVIFTSNIPISKLVDTTLRKDGSEAERIKALRIHERIVELTEQFPITGKYKERTIEDYEN